MTSTTHGLLPFNGAKKDIEEYTDTTQRQISEEFFSRL